MKFNHKDAQWEWDNRLPDDDPEQVAFCKKSCPFYKPYEHPTHHMVWCDHLAQNLNYWDGIVAMCQLEISERDPRHQKITTLMNARDRPED